MKKYRNIKIGALFLFTLFILIWGVNFLKGLSLFKSENHYFVVYDKIGGMEVSSRIMLHGFQVGQVSKIDFDTIDYKSLIVELTLTKNVKIPVKSVAKIISSDLMGTKEIDLILSDSTSYHKDNDTLIADIESDLREEVNAQISPIKAKAEDLMASFDTLLVGVQSVFTNKTRQHIADIFSEINKTIRNLNNITHELDHFVKEEKGNVSNIIANIDSISGSLVSNTEEINNIFKNVSVISDSISKLDFANTLQQANDAFADMKEITTKINSGEGSLGLLLNDTKLYNNLDKASEELNLLLKDLRENPKRYVHYSIFGRKEKKASQNLE